LTKGIAGLANQVISEGRLDVGRRYVPQMLSTSAAVSPQSRSVAHASTASEPGCARSCGRRTGGRAGEGHQVRLGRVTIPHQAREAGAAPRSSRA
jgi:hypothetical protein